jgi:hypothetical protein
LACMVAAAVLKVAAALVLQMCRLMFFSTSRTVACWLLQ